MKKIIKEIKRTIEDMDKPLLILMLIFIIFGTLNIVTASSREAVVRYNASLYHYFNQQIKMLFISLIGSTIIISIPNPNTKILGGFNCFFVSFFFPSILFKFYTSA